MARTAAVKPAVGSGLRENTARLRAFIADQIRAAQAAGDASADVEPVHAATALYALVEGLGLHVLGRQYSPDMALTLFDAQLDALFRPAATDDPDVS